MHLVLFYLTFFFSNAVYVMDPTMHEDVREFAYGSGLLNPMKAIDPGVGLMVCTW